MHLTNFPRRDNLLKIFLNSILMAQITDILARQILDSRGNPTVEVDVLLDDNSFGRAAVPSGASTGAHEALELRDGDKSKYLGKSVEKAVENARTTILEAVKGKDFEEQSELDSFLNELDGTENKGNLGANAILGVSLAFAWANANSREQSLFEYIGDVYETEDYSLPRPMFNIMNGGKHANWSTDIQEFMVISHAEMFSEQIQMGVEIFQHLGKLLEAKGLSTNIGNEGGYAPGFSSNQEAFEIISQAVEKAGYRLGEDVSFALDVAASEFYDAERNLYVLKTEDRELTTAEWSSYLDELMGKYPLISIEDPFGEDHWEAWQEFHATHKELQLVGDDLLVTNKDRVSKAIDTESCNALLVKVNQIGTLTETLEAMCTAQKAGWNNVVSHRSGETEDVTISHLAVGTACGQIKTGAPSRGERTAKYNELIRIAEEL